MRAVGDAEEIGSESENFCGTKGFCTGQPGSALAVVWGRNIKWAAASQAELAPGG
jgi:hypothetical protein